MQTGDGQALREGGTELTFLHAREDLVLARRWDVSTLEPPRLTLRSLLTDLSWEIQQARESGLGFGTTACFLFLRTLQRIAYNAGWSIGGRRT